MSKLDPQLEQHFNSLEQQYNLPSNLLKSVAYTESRYNSDAKSPVGASGMFQFMPATAKQYGVDTSDPYSSAEGAAKMYAQLLKSNGGDLSKALAGYNWGQGNLNKKGLDNAPQETKNYISQITGLMGQKKNVNNGTTQDYYNGYNNSMSKLDSDNDELKAYKEMIQHQQQESEEMQAYQQMMQFQAQQQQQPVAQQTMSPVQVAQNNNAFGANKNAQLNQTAINPALTTDMPASLQQNAPMSSNAQAMPVGNNNNTKAQAIASKILSISDPNAAATLFNNASPSQQEYIKGILQDQFNRENPNGSSTVKNAWTGVMRTLQNTNNSMTQMIASGKSAITGNDSDLKTINEKISRDKNFDNLQDIVDPSMARTAGQVVGEVAQFATPGAIAKVAPAATKLARVGQLATEGAIGSVAMNPVEDAQNAGDVLKGKATQAATGAALNAAGGLAGEYVAQKGANVVNNIKNANKPLSQASQDVAQDFENQGVRYFANDLPDASQALNKKVQDFTAKNESMRDNVAGQQKDLNKAYDNFSNSLQKPEIQKIADESGLNKVLSDTSHPLYNDAKAVADKIDNMDLSDPNAILKASAEAKLIGNKSKVIDLHNNATDIAPDVNIPVINASKSLSDLNDYMQQLKNTTTKNNLKPVVKDIEDSVAKIKSGQNSIVDIDGLIQSVTNSAKTAVKNGDSNIASIYKDFKSSLVKDKEDYINALPDSTEVSAYKLAYNNAKDFNKQSSLDAKNLFTDGNIPESLIKKWIQKGQTNKVQSVYDILPDSAKQAVQQGVINKITKEATDSAGNVIPEKLVKAYNNYKDINAGNTPLSVVFDANTKEALDSLVRISKNIKNIGINANTNSGVGLTDMVKGAKNITSLATAHLTHGLSLVEPVYKFLKDKAFLKGVTDPKFQKMLINLNSLNPSSSAYAKKLGEMSGYIATASYNNKE